MQQFISNGFYKHKTLRLTKASLIKTTITTVIVAKTTTTTLKITHFAVELPSFVIVATAMSVFVSSLWYTLYQLLMVGCMYVARISSAHITVYVATNKQTASHNNNNNSYRRSRRAEKKEKQGHATERDYALLTGCCHYCHCCKLPLLQLRQLR